MFNEPITMSVHEIILMIIAMCAAIVTIYKAAKVFGVVFLKLKSPADKLAQRLTAVEEKITKIEKKLDKNISTSDIRIKTLEQGDSVTQEAILALLSHAINNNNIDGLKTAKKKLETYLIERGVHNDMVYETL